MVLNFVVLSKVTITRAKTIVRATVSKQTDRRIELSLDSFPEFDATQGKHFIKNFNLSQGKIIGEWDLQKIWESSRVTERLRIFVTNQLHKK
jgi:hypothetical protein